MKLLKPKWVHHDEKPIYSVDVHPDGKRFATGGCGTSNDTGRVCIWNLMPVLYEDAQFDPKVPKMLCQLDNHLACVNCVRWSHNGQMLASAGDDKIIMIWKLGKGASAIFGTDGAGIKKTPENWRCVSTLRGHSGDVLDVSWSPYDRWLATCSVDNNIIIWDAQNFPNIIIILKGHSGLVKGVEWDPVGRFVATQSDDKSIRIWSTSDWTCISTITEPFLTCGGTTHVLRLSWSPDGLYLVSAHAMNGYGPTAQIIERTGWKCDKDFVGHRKAVTCVRFHNSILKQTVTSAMPIPFTNKLQQYCCLAVGSRDRTLSVWVTASQRPLVVIHDLFKDSILDLSWSPDRCILIACSTDGTIACLSFLPEELGIPLSEEDKNSIYLRIYGKPADILCSQSDKDTLLEYAELVIDEQKEKYDVTYHSIPKRAIVTTATTTTTTSTTTTTTTATPTTTPITITSSITTTTTSTTIFTSSSSSTNPAIANSLTKTNDIITNHGVNEVNNLDLDLHSKSNNNVMVVSPSKAIQQQIEKRTSDGKRRITPMFIPLNQTNDTENSTSIRSGNIRMDTDENHTQNQLNSEMKSNVLINPEEQQQQSITSPNLKINELNPNLDNRLTKKISTTIQQQQSHQQPLPPPLPIKSNSINNESDMNIAAAGSGSNNFNNGINTKTTNIKTSIPCTGKAIALQGTYAKLTNEHRIQIINSCVQTAFGGFARVLCLPVTKNTSITTSNSNNNNNTNTNNNNNNSSNSNSSRQRQQLQQQQQQQPPPPHQRHQYIWDTFIGSPIVNFSVCPKYVLICSIDGTIRLFNIKTGELVFPTLKLPTAAVQCGCSINSKLGGVVSECGVVRIWNMDKKKIYVSTNCSDLLCGGSTVIQFHVTERGAVLLLFSNGSSYAYCKNLESWAVLNSRDALTRFGLSVSTQNENKNMRLFPLASVQSTTFSQPFTAATSQSFTNMSDSSWHQTAKLVFIENQIQICISINSPVELEYWYSQLGVHLAKHGTETRIRILLDDLLGPVHHSSALSTLSSSPSSATSTSSPSRIMSSQQDNEILGINKHTLLAKVLNSLKDESKWQRIYMEYLDQMNDLLRHRSKKRKLNGYDDSSNNKTTATGTTATDSF